MKTQMEIKEKISGKLNMPARYVFAAVRIFNMLITSVQAGCMSIAITSMVRSPSTSSSVSNSTSNFSTSISSDKCPITADTASDIIAAEKGGDFDWTELTQSYVTNGGTYGGLCTMMLGAYIAQRWSPKLMMTYISIVSIVCMLLTPVLAKWNVYALIASRIVGGLAAGGGMPASGQLESTWFPPDERQQLSGMIMSSLHVGSIISASLTGVLIEHFGWEFVFYFYGAISAVSLLTWVVFVYDSPQTHPRISDEEKEYIAARVVKITDEKLPVPWIQIAMSPPVWAYLSMSVSITWLLFIFMTELPTYLKRMLYYSTSNAGYLTSFAYAATVTSQLLSTFLSQWLRKKGYFSHLTSYRIFNAIATLGPAATLIALTQVSCDSTTIVGLLILTMFLHGAFVSGSMLNHMDLAINFVPALVGISGTIISVVGVISPTIAAAIINNNQTLSAWSKVFYISAAVSAAPYFFFFIFGSVDEQPWNKPQFEIKKKESKTTEKSESQDKKEETARKDCTVNIS